MPAGRTIINTASIEAYKPSPILLDYATTKAAINTFSKSLAQQVQAKGFGSTLLLPAQCGLRYK